MSEVENFLAHYGVKGMRWGVRKKTAPAVEILGPRNKGVTIRSDGSMDVKPGASLQRLTRSNGKSLPMKDLTYASLNEYDNARYVKTIGGKGFFGGGRDQILAITATKPIKAPSVTEATRITSDLMLNDKTFRDKNTNMLGEKITAKELSRIRENPVGTTAKLWYEQTNVKLTFDKDFDPDAPAVQKKVKDAMLAKGYNALRDENDFNSKIAKAPVIIFNPEDSLKVVNVTKITDELRAANKATLKEYGQRGKAWLDSEFYD